MLTSLLKVDFFFYFLFILDKFEKQMFVVFFFEVDTEYIGKVLFKNSNIL